MQKPAGNAGLWGVSPYLLVSTWLPRQIAHNCASLAVERFLPITSPLLLSSPKLTDASTSSFWCSEATQIAQPGFWQWRVFSSSRYWPARRGEGLFFCHPTRTCSRRGSAGTAAARCCGEKPLECSWPREPLWEPCAAMATAQHHSSRWRPQP